MTLEQLLVVIPHSGILVPGEIPMESLSEHFPSLLENIDWYTHWLYDFRDILNNRQVAFPYCSLILEANRHPELLDDSVPLKDVYGRALYRPGHAPDPMLRAGLAQKHLAPFHRAIEAGLLGAEDAQQSLEDVAHDEGGVDRSRPVHFGRPDRC